MLYYDLENDHELSNLAVSEDAQIFYSEEHKPLVCDPSLGVIDICTKEILHEYGIKRLEKSQFERYDMSHSNKMISNAFGKYFVTSTSIVMPYSLISVIQHFQPVALDLVVDRFFTSDYYKIEGNCTLHKFMHQPTVLEKFIDSYQE